MTENKPGTRPETNLLHGEQAENLLRKCALVRQLNSPLIINFCKKLIILKKVSWTQVVSSFRMEFFSEQSVRKKQLSLATVVVFPEVGKSKDIWKGHVQVSVLFDLFAFEYRSHL